MRDTDLRACLIAVADFLFPSPRARRLLREVYYKCRFVVSGLSETPFTSKPLRKWDGKSVLDRLETAKVSSTTPLCSVIIPVFNNEEFTRRCLVSLLMAEVSTPFEVIAVDNASSDGTGKMLSWFDGWVTVLRNDTNEGFVSACNKGANAAIGEYLVFLNNDTETTDGWLDALVDTMLSHEDAGAVGAKLVYPDGTLQEAGGIIWRDGSASNYGNRDNPALFRYNYMREVDYCSAACLMVRKYLFDRLGGFDVRYSPGYSEDSDLCFGISSLGYKVLYQPMCETIHYEGATAGKDISSGLKQYQVINNEKFKDKWRDALERQQPKSAGNTEYASDRCDGPHILFIDLQVPRPDQDSGSVKIVEFIKILLGMGCRISFLYRWRETPDSARYCRELGKIGVRLVHERDVYKELASDKYDLVLVDRFHIAEVYLNKIKNTAPDVPVVFETADINFIREMRKAEVTGDARLKKEAASLKKREMNIARACQLTIAITETDREYLLREDPTLNIAIIPNIHKPVDVVPSLYGRDALMFIGGYRHPPNVDAMLFFVEEIYPVIGKRLGGVKLLIAGSYPPPEITALATEDIIVTGYVPDVAPYYGRSRVFVCPLRYGSGMKGKIGEALTFGVPVVTTTIGAEGMGLVNGETALICDEPEAFADAVCRLYTDDGQWLRMAAAGQEYIKEYFSPDAVRGKLSVISDLASAYRNKKRASFKQPRP